MTGESKDFDYREGLETLRVVSALAVKSLLSLNGGAIIVLMTFIGNANNQNFFSIEPYLLKYSMLFFLAGTIAAAALFILGYTRNYLLLMERKGLPLTRGNLRLYLAFAYFSLLSFSVGVTLVAFSFGPLKSQYI
ncbi:MAG: hypothetical protein AAGD04_09710 [Pseudomonadota bacterium]